MNLGGKVGKNLPYVYDSWMLLLFLVQILGDEIPNGTLTRDMQSSLENGIGQRSFDERLLISKNMDVNGAQKLLNSQKCTTSLGQRKGEGTMLPFDEVNTCSPNITEQSVGSSMFVKPDNSRSHQGPQPSLNFSLSNLGASSSVLPFSDGIVEGSEQNKVSPNQQGQRARHILPKPPKPGSIASSEATKGVPSQTRIARPPAEGRGRSQLLPRYWPRITDQELQQISGEYP